MLKRNARVAEEVVYAIVPAIAFYAWNEALDFFPVDLQQNRINKDPKYNLNASGEDGQTANDRK